VATGIPGGMMGCEICHRVRDVLNSLTVFIPASAGGAVAHEEWMPPKILIIDDDETTLWLLGTLLQHHSFNVIKASSASVGLQLAQEETPDLVLLDVMMPEMDGWEVCRRLRETSAVPIIFITAKSSVKDVVKGLEIGGDDYIVKPFNNHELLARIRTQLRRSVDENVVDELVFADGNLRINFQTREVTVHGEDIVLTPKEFTLLSVLARNAGRVLTRGELVTQTWGPEYGEANESLKLYIHYLRKKIERDPNRPEFILTSRGVGYRFAAK
jgi:two-component system, OmpR family, KDP operon response regulator KdpE